MTGHLVSVRHFPGLWRGRCVCGVFAEGPSRGDVVEVLSDCRRLARKPVDGAA